MRWEELELYDGVEDTLATLKDSHRLILVTKGNHEEQMSKVDRTGVGKYFEALEILAEKTPAEYARLDVEHDLDPDDT